MADARTIDEKVDIHAPGVVCKKSACYFCHQNCGVLAYVKDGDVLRIEGDPAHGTNQGGLCCRGNIALKHLHHPARINYPLKRAGAKGENKWEKISWEQAISEIAERLNQIKAESGAEAVATAGGTLRTEDWSRRRFMNIFGSPNSFHNALLCWIPTFMVETAVSGWSPFETDLGSSKCLILWGMNPGASSMPGMRGYTDLHKNGLKIIVVDPRYSETAAHADLWLPLRPGSDTALALAMLNVIINEGMFDFEFVDEWCEGFSDLADQVEQYTPEWAAPLTWLKPDQIREAARMYATNRPGNIQWGCTADQMGRTAGAGMHARACMRAITGNLDRPGGDVMPGPAAYVTDEELEANDMLPEEMKAKQIGSDKFKLTSWPGYQRVSDIAKATWGKAPTAEWMCEAHGPSVFKAILTGDPYQVRALLVSATNPINSYGDSKMTLAAMRSVEFLVVCDYWMTPTAVFADYIMPIAGALERPTIHTNYGVTDSIVGTQRAINPLYGRHTDFEFWRDLGLACGQTKEQWPWDREEDVFFYMLKPLGLPIKDYDDFVENFGGVYYPPQHFFRYQDHGFCTASRKVELKSSVLEELGYPAVPTYIGPCESEQETPEVAEEYPLVLTTGGGFMPYHHSEHFNIAELRFLYKEPRFTINPRTAKKMGIKEGDWCWIETRRGRIKQRAALEESVGPRVIFAGRGWWYPERDLDVENPYGCLDSNVNVLTSVDDADCDPIGGSWANRGLLCKVYHVQPGDQVTNEFSIPGNAKEPGIHETYSQSKLAYEVVPKPRRTYPPDFDVPEGLEWNDLRRVAVDPKTGFVYNQKSGWLVDPETNGYYDVATGYAYDAEHQDLVDEAGKHYDITTKKEKLDKAPYDLPQGVTWDYATQAGWDLANGRKYDPDTKWLVNPDTGDRYDAKTGYKYDEAAGEIVDEATGDRYDAKTRERHYPGPTYELPQGITWDGERQQGFDDKGRVYDPGSGWMVDPESDVLYDVQSGYAYDPRTNDLVDKDGTRYDVRTYQRRDGKGNDGPAFKMPDNLTWDAFTKQAWEPATGRIYDPESGWLVDPNTNVLYDVSSGLAYDPRTEDLVDAMGNHYDLVTRAYRGAGFGADKPTFEIPDGLTWDAYTKQAFDAKTGRVYDPESGWLVDPDTNVFYDLKTGYALDPRSDDFMDDKGNHYDRKTLAPKAADAKGGER